MTPASQSISPLLCIDAGNSRIKWALTGADPAHFAQQGVFAHEDTHHAFSISAEPDWSDLPVPRSVWISNVAGERCAQRIETLIRARWLEVPCHTVHARAQQCGVRNGYGDVRQLGSDRWASLVGAHAVWPDEAMLIATIGTAMTLDLLDADGYFAGGLIAPGGHLMMQTLGAHTALLPTLALEEDENEYATRLQAIAEMNFATDTHTALRTGCLLAQTALVERVWHAARQRLKMPVRCVLSGGGAAHLRPLLTIETTHCAPLVLLGLTRIAQTYALSNVRADTTQQGRG